MRVDSYLKGLAETRARADADYQNALEAAGFRTAHLDQVTAAYESKSKALRRSIRQAQAQADEAHRARDACDQLIRKLKQGIDPTLIPPVDGWQGRYGKRGALGRAVQTIVEAAYPHEISTTRVGEILQQQLGLSFSSPPERANWFRYVVRGRLKYLCQLGYVERLHPAKHDGKIGRWRAIPAGAPNDLAALASAAGIPLTFFTKEPLPQADPRTRMTSPGNPCTRHPPT